MSGIYKKDNTLWLRDIFFGMHVWLNGWNSTYGIFRTDRKMENNHMPISVDVDHRKLSGDLKYKGISSSQ